MNVDGGTEFGTWTDETSRLIYHDAMPALLCGTDTGGSTLDLGGANGLARQWFAHVTTVDNDASKHPNVVDDLTTYVPPRDHDRVLLRYVLHYLDDDAVRRLMRHVASWHQRELTVIQFVNDDLSAKQAMSVNEVKWFRSEADLVGLLHPWVPVHRVAVSYFVVPEFYTNRLAHPHPSGHPETVVAYNCKVPA